METDIINRAKAAIAEAFPLVIKYKVVHFGPTDIPGAMRFCPDADADATRGILLEYERVHVFCVSIVQFEAVINSLHILEDPPLKYFKHLENFFEQLEAISMLPLPIREAVSEYLVSIIINPDSIYSYYYNDRLVESVRRRILYS